MRRLPPPPVLLFIFLLLFGGGLVLLYPERLAESLRPWLERVAANRLDARVRIGRFSSVSLFTGTVSVENLRLEREGEWRLSVPHMDAEFTLSGLLARNIHSLHLEKPSLSIIATPEEASPPSLPDRPPLNIDRLEIANGRLHLSAGGRKWQAAAFEFKGALQPVSFFEVATRLGEGDGIPLRARGELDWQTPTLTLQELRWEEHALLASPLVVALPVAGPAAEGTFGMADFDSDRLTDLLAAFGLETPLPAGWRFTLEQPQARIRLTEAALYIEVDVPTAEVTDGEGTRLPISQARLQFSGWGEDWRGDGNFRLAGADATVRGRYAKGAAKGALHLQADAAAEFKQQLLGGDLPPLAGGVSVAAEFSLAPGQARLHGRLTGRPNPRQKDFFVDLGRLSADMTVEKQSSVLSGSATISLGDRMLARLRGTPERLRLELLPVAGVDLLPLLGAGHRSDLLAGAEAVSGDAEIVRDSPGGWRARIGLRAALVKMPGGGGLRQAALSGQVRPGPTAMVFDQGRFAAELSGEGWPKGKIAGRIGGQLAADDYRLRLETVSLTGLDYTSPDGLSGFTGGHLAGRGIVAGRLGAPTVAIDVTADFGVGEVLKDAFYADLAALPASIGLRGALDPVAGGLRIEEAKLDVAGIIAAALTGSLARNEGALRASFSVPALDRALTGGFGAGLAGMLPALGGLELAGAVDGEMSAAFTENSWRLRGEVRPQALDLDWPTLRLSAQGGHGVIPFALSSQPDDSWQGEPAPGEMNFDHLQVGPAVLAQSAIGILSAPGSFALNGPLLFNIAGGGMQFAEMSAQFPATGPRLATRLKLAGIDLRSLTRELDLPAMEGRLSADLGRIRYAEGAVAADGVLEIDAFAGDIRVRNLRLESLFSGYPNYYADVDFAGIDLAQLTRTFAFGEINGTADGYVHDLRLFGNTPAAFDALFATRERGRRNISVKALRNISVLSEGGFSAVLSRGVYRFVDFYRYRKIAIACSLRNDVFTMEGTARPGSDRYLVFGGWLPPKIDIVAPVHTISFKEMVKRLQRIDRTERPMQVGEN
ncbi:MAG: hypothetical protein WCY68_09940 [Desulfuromonadales bacterium]